MQIAEVGSVGRVVHVFVQEDESGQKGFSGQVDNGASVRRRKFFGICYGRYHAVADDHRLVLQYLEVFDISEFAMNECDDRSIVIDVFLYPGGEGYLAY